MADLSYKVTVDTKQADKAIDGLTKSIGGLKTALGGLAFGAFISNAFRSAEAVQDLAEATGFATQSILGIGRAFQENGSSIQAAQDAIARFTKNVGEAASGSANLQQSFSEVGVSLRDLATLSEEQLFLKTIQGLGQITDKATQARLASELLGKSARANFGGIAGSINGYIAASAEAAKANQAADAAAANFERAVTNLQQQLLIALEPISKLAAGINTSSQSIGEFIKIAGSIALVVGSMTLLGRAGSFIAAIFTTIKKAGQSLGKTIEVLVHLYKRFTGAIEVSKPKNTIFGALTKSVGYLLKALGALIGALGTIASFIIPDTVLAGFKKLGQLLGIVKDDAAASEEAVKKANEASFAAHQRSNQAAQEEIANQRQVINALQEKVVAIQQVGQSYADQNRELVNSLTNEAKYLQMSDNQAETQKALDDLYKRTADTIQGLYAQKAKLNDKQIEEKKAIDETIASINNQARADAERISTAITNLQKERDAIDARNRALEFGETIRKDTAALEQMQNEIDMLYMTTDQREQYSKLLQAEANFKNRLADIDREAANIGKNATDSQIADFERRRQAAIAYYNSEKEMIAAYKAAQEDQTRQIQVWSEETKKALQDSISPANQVKNFWDGLSGQIDNFARTGKFKVKEFLASIIQDFIAAKLKLAALDFLKSIGLGGGGGLFGGAIIPGFLAGGGNAQQGKPYIVGEKGPELFVPPTAGRVVPNNQLGSGAVSAPVTNNYITNNISALDAQSVAQLFAANRKTLLGTVKMAERELPYAA
jgi:lambda family phage tail tape measure protein